MLWLICSGTVKTVVILPSSSMFELMISFLSYAKLSDSLAVISYGGSVSPTEICKFCGSESFSRDLVYRYLTEHLSISTNFCHNMEEVTRHKTIPDRWHKVRYEDTTLKS